MTLAESEYENMTVEELEGILSERERRFVTEYEKDENCTLAAIRAGYNPGSKNRNASSIGSRLMRKKKIQAYRRALEREAKRTPGIDEDEVEKRILDIYERCMQSEPVYVWSSEEKVWKPSGQWKLDSKGALNALDMIVKYKGMFKEKGECEVRVESLENYLRRLDEEEKRAKQAKLER